MLIKRLLIANRGEIACRIIETCQRIGIESVAVYAIADKNQKHVLMADQAICIGEGPPETSYLHASNIIQAAISLECDAIHPGYGFLSENAQFIKQVQAAGLLFVGPALSVIQKCGNKLWVKQLVQSINVPTVPGVEHTITSNLEIENIVSEFGYPCILKANYGAGGRHIYILNNHDELDELLMSLKTKTLQQQPIEFYLERYLTPIKHFEVQLIADQFQHVIAVDVRDCSLQMHHQKIIETTAHALEPRLRENLIADALKIAKLLDIDNVCTIEFIVDGYHNHYFIEINPRLQVEHAISEVIYNIDLVQIQLESIQKQALKFKQSDFNSTSHALEARLYITDKREEKIDFFYMVSYQSKCNES